ncbi:hypothetical protein C7T94_13270 [Pedobacter yulinensis]|uniref:AraC-type arabinose-binding/dimerisation domain-containing protein n=1 Tax=Pedobacter yulinensis TaxID=2126353 RepID=A0A2T3HM29_9SPHI|nr:hypothetical protein [Pedobacter yulinensis]PST83518.1 hypothetical protein C7T94_13270 [Pedobacter yulinensis]
MEEKRNRSTYNRPAGDRTIDAEVLHIDLPKFRVQIKTEEAWLKSDRNAITVFKTEGMTITLLALHQGALLQPGSYEGTGLLTVQILEGEMEFVTEADVFRLTEGQLINLHEHLPFRSSATQETLALLTMVRFAEPGPVAEQPESLQADGFGNMIDRPPISGSTPPLSELDRTRMENPPDA